MVGHARGGEGGGAATSLNEGLFPRQSYARVRLESRLELSCYCCYINSLLQEVSIIRDIISGIMMIMLISVGRA